MRNAQIQDAGARVTRDRRKLSWSYHPKLLRSVRDYRPNFGNYSLSFVARQCDVRTYVRIKLARYLCAACQSGSDPINWTRFRFTFLDPASGPRCPQPALAGI